jgi:hypothetical protein
MTHPNLELDKVYNDLLKLLTVKQVGHLTCVLNDLAETIQHGAGVVEGLGYVLGSIKCQFTPIGLMELARALENEAKEKLKKFPANCGENHMNGTICYLTEGHGGKHTGHHPIDDNQFTWPISIYEKPANSAFTNPTADSCNHMNGMNSYTLHYGHTGHHKEYTMHGDCLGTWKNEFSPIKISKCLADKGLFVCTLPVEHEGDHMAVDHKGTVLHQWTQSIHKCGDKCLPYKDDDKSEWCNAPSSTGISCYCSLPKGHSGDHVACSKGTDDHDVGVWPQEPEGVMPYKCKYAIVNKDGSKEQCIKQHGHTGDHESNKGETWA